MTWDNLDEEEHELSEGDQWQLFASAGYASAESVPSSEDESKAESEEEDVVEMQRQKKKFTQDVKIATAKER